MYLAAPESKPPGHTATCWLHFGLRYQRESKACTWLMIWPPDTQFILMCTQCSLFGQTQTDAHLSSCAADVIGSKVHCDRHFTGPYAVDSTTPCTGQKAKAAYPGTLCPARVACLTPRPLSLCSARLSSGRLTLPSI